VYGAGPSRGRRPLRCDRCRPRAPDGASGHTVTVEVKVNDEVMPGVISLPHGWGHDLPGIRLEVATRRSGANALLDENLRDALSGNAVLSGVPVRLEPENA
jgi:anaerobic selenocysteine-containing dehydrogenase